MPAYGYMDAYGKIVAKTKSGVDKSITRSFMSTVVPFADGIYITVTHAFSRTSYIPDADGNEVLYDDGSPLIGTFVETGGAIIDGHITVDSKTLARGYVPIGDDNAQSEVNNHDKAIIDTSYTSGLTNSLLPIKTQH